MKVLTVESHVTEFCAATRVMTAVVMKKVRNIIHLLICFEESGLRRGLFKKETKVNEFRGYCWKLLEEVLKDDKVLSQNPSESVALAIILIACSKTGTTRK